MARESQTGMNYPSSYVEVLRILCCASPAYAHDDLELLLLKAKRRLPEVSNQNGSPRQSLWVSQNLVSSVSLREKVGMRG